MFRQLVGVHFVQDDGSVLFWRWNVLFLGVRDAVFIFSKLLVPHKNFLRKQGIRAQVYIDDQRVIAESYVKCKQDTGLALEALAKAGWVVNVKKSSDPPVQSMTFLGLVNCTLSMKYFVPDIKKQAICKLLLDVLHSNEVHIKVLAKLLGKLQFCERAFGPCIRLLSRSSYRLISNAENWNCMLKISDFAKRELMFILENFDFLNGHPIRASQSLAKVDITLASDASDLGLCVYEVKDENSVLLKRVFSKEESAKSSTVRELLAFHSFYLSDKADMFKDRNVLHYTDNANCAIILSIGSRSVSLQQLVLDIFLAWKSRNMKVHVEHLSRDHEIIQFADTESRLFDLQDYSFDFDSFIWISGLFGPFELDCFASEFNKKCVDYFSKFYFKDCLGVNFFAQSLPDRNLFVFPPVSLIVPAIMHLRKYNARGCLIVPKWTSSHFWTHICDDGVHFNDFVIDFVLFSPEYLTGVFVRNDTFKGVKKFATLALKFEFRGSSRLISQKSKKFCSLGGCFMCS